MLLIAGGSLDPNLRALVRAADLGDHPWIDLRHTAAGSPRFHWRLGDVRLPFGDGRPPVGAFIRQDVFGSMADPRPEVARRAHSWFVAVHGWLLAHPHVRLFNRHIDAAAHNKPAALLRARACGLRIPDTWLTDDAEWLRERRAAGPSIVKPVAGGGLCQTLDDGLAGVTTDFTAMPALVQRRLVAPEFRIFVIGDDRFAFEVISPSLDYRELQDAEIRAVTVPPEADALARLMKDFGMDFGAADFKTDPDSGELVFLELNTSPMFERFDDCVKGALGQAMVRHLMC
jgi:glutathione synthase/RimK-type ligase-like ATP-grasp enzyme